MKQTMLDAFNFRHACKEFDSNKKISKDDFEFIMKSIQLSPSSFGLEPWKVINVNSAKARELLLPVIWGAQTSLPTASHFLIFLSGKSSLVKPDSPYIKHILTDIHKFPEDAIKLRSHYYKEHFDKVMSNEKEIQDWTGKQTYIALGNAMTAAATIGIDSCPIEGFIKPAVEKILIDLGIDLIDYTLSVMVALGYRKDTPTRTKTRQPISDIFSEI